MLHLAQVAVVKTPGTLPALGVPIASSVPRTDSQWSYPKRQIERRLANAHS